MHRRLGFRCLSGILTDSPKRAAQHPGIGDKVGSGAAARRASRAWTARTAHACRACILRSRRSPVKTPKKGALIAQGKPGMDGAERAVAIRSLLVSTARESPDAALHAAVADIDRFRRAGAAQ